MSLHANILEDSVNVRANILTTRFVAMVPFPGFKSNLQSFQSSKFASLNCFFIDVLSQPLPVTFLSTTTDDKFMRKATPDSLRRSLSHFFEFTNHEMLFNAFEEVCVGKLFHPEDEYHLQCLQSFVMPRKGDNRFVSVSAIPKPSAFL